MQEKKSCLLAIYEILRDYSDEDHYLSNSKIAEYLKQRLNQEFDQRTIRANIETLIDYGVEIEHYRDNHKGYYLIDRDFEDSEITLLCNCVHSAHYIPDKASKELISKLLNKQSKYKRTQFINQNYISNTKKTQNKQLFYNIEILSKAIDQKQVVTFEYLRYNEQKKLVKKREKPYVLSPYFIVQQNENLYLLCRGKNHPNIAHYRIDKMREIEILEDEPYLPLQESFDPYQYIKNKKFMFSDEEVRVHMYCHERMLDDVIDQFGKETSIQKDIHNKEYYHVMLTSSAQGILYFALQYLEFAEILEPKDLRNQVKEMLENGIKKYQ